MRKLCPQCQGVFETQFLCPKCGVQLSEMSGRSTILASRDDDGAARQVGMATRFVAGLLLAQCSYYALRLMGVSFFRLLGEPDGWASPAGGLAAPGLMMLTALAGGILAGAGNPRGLAAGAAVGLFHALALIAAEFALGHTPGRPVLFGGWIAVALLGAVAGRQGRAIWPPLSDIVQPLPTMAQAPAAPQRRKKREPIAWVRIVVGTIVAIAGTVCAGRIREYVIGTSGGVFMADSRFQLQFVTWVIAALALLAGGAIAGASTRAGLRHGLIVGFLACLGAFLIQVLAIKDGLPAERFLGTVMGLSEDDGGKPARLALYLLSHALVLCTAGGGFGAALLPRTSAGPKQLDRGAI